MLSRSFSDQSSGPAVTTMTGWITSSDRCSVPGVRYRWLTRPRPKRNAQQRPDIVIRVIGEDLQIGDACSAEGCALERRE